MQLTKRIHHNIKFLQEQFNNSTDLVVRRFNINIPGIREIAGALVFFDGLISNQLITDAVLILSCMKPASFSSPSTRISSRS